MNMLNRVGERTEPCGTPAWGVNGAERVPLWLILVTLSSRKLQRIFCVSGGRLKLLQILCFNPVCQTVSKAFWISFVTHADL